MGRGGGGWLKGGVMRNSPIYAINMVLYRCVESKWVLFLDVLKCS